MFRQPANSLSLSNIVKNTLLAKKEITEINVNELFELKAKTQDLPADRLLGIILKMEIVEDSSYMQGFMISIISKKSLDNLFQIISNEQPGPMDYMEAIDKLSAENKPLVNFLMGYQESLIKGENKEVYSEVDKQKELVIENRYISENLRNKGLMKQISYNIIEALYHVHGDFIVRSQPIHMATLKFFVTSEKEKDALTNKAADVNIDGHVSDCMSYGVLTAKPALILLRHHSPVCNPGLQSHWQETTSATTSTFESANAQSEQVKAQSHTQK